MVPEQAFILGLTQGLTELLPVSSSGHLIVASSFFGWQDQGPIFDIFVHLATALAIIIFFVREAGANILSSERGEQGRWKKTVFFFFLLFWAVIPAALAGFFWGEQIISAVRRPRLVAFNLIFFAVILWLAERREIVNRRRTEGLGLMNWKQSLSIGLAQMLAFMPGVSRSGATISAGLLVGLDKRTAVKFSFLAGLPLIIAAGCAKLPELMINNFNAFGFNSLAIAFLSAFLSSLAALKILSWMAEKTGFKYFVLYRLALGLVIFIFL